MLVGRAFMLFISLVLVSTLAWYMAKNVFSHRACELISPDDVAAIESKIMQVEAYRKLHGKLPPEAKTASEVLDLAYYEVLADGTYEIQNICFDCNTVVYRESDKKWHCGL